MEETIVASEETTVEVDQSKPSMTMDQIRAYAQDMMRRYEHDKKVAFYDHWLTRLGLDPTIARLEKAHKAKSVVRNEKLKRRGKRN